MNSYYSLAVRPRTRNPKPIPARMPFALLAVLASLLGLFAVRTAQAAPNIVLWDTSAPLGDTLNLQERAAWKAVPSDLLSLEADPAKARSDPGYYGRDYVFKGDAVVENRELTAVFWSAKGRVVIYRRDQSASSDPSEGPIGTKLVEVMPLQSAGASATISNMDIQWNADDQAALEVQFSAPGQPAVSGVFAFDKTGIVEIKPMENMNRLRLTSPVAYGVVPAFGGDDLVFNPADYDSSPSLWIPAQNVFLGLVQGEDSEVMMTWPTGKQKLALQLGKDSNGSRLIQSIDFQNDGQSLFLTVLSAPGIWHQEPLGPSFLERDVAIKWRPPFPAKWKTQLSEQGVEATYAFRNAKGDIWRGVPGSYDYPVWFDGDQAMFHLSKKVPPQGQAVIYCLEGRNTPPSITTPVDIMEATLGRSLSDAILDLAGRKLRTHHRRGAEGVRRACTCGCTEAIQAVFETGDEVAKKDYIQGAIGDMIYFVHRHVERIDKYRGLADSLTKYLQAQETAEPDLKPYLDSLQQIVAQIPQEYNVQKENMKSFKYADDLARQTMALTRTKGPNNLKAYMDLLNEWRGMGGSQDYVLALCHTITRKLCQQAGYGCATQPEAVPIAEEVRARCHACLRNPDGYEIWADY